MRCSPGIRQRGNVSVHEWKWDSPSQIGDMRERENYRKSNRAEVSTSPASSDIIYIRCKLGHRRNSTLQWLHIAVATHNCCISLRSGVHPPGYAPCNPSQTPPFTPILHHSPCLPDTQTSLFFFKHSFTVSIHLYRRLPTERLPANTPT